MADGSIIIETDLDAENTYKKLARLENKIDSLNDKIQDKKAERLPVAEEAERLGGLLDAAKVKLDKLMAEGGTPEAIETAKEAVDSYQAAWNQTVAEVERYDRIIDRSERELSAAKIRAGDLSKSLSEAGYNADKMQKNVKKADKSAKSFAARMKAVVRSALVFTVISQALSKLRDWVGDVIKVSPEASAAIAKLKGALLTMVQPLVNVIIPAFTTLVNILTSVVSRLAQLFSFLTGTTVESSAQAAKALNEQTEALDGTGAAAKKAGKSLASFDEINKLSSNKDSGGASATEIAPDFSGYDEISNRLKDIADAVLLIAAGFALWKLSSHLPDALSGIASQIGLILIAIGGLIVLWNGLKDAWENGVDWSNLLLIIGGVVTVVLALYKAFGKTAAGIALVVAGAAMIVTAFHDIINNGANLQNTLLLIAGIVAAGLGFFFLTGSVVPLVIAAIASVIVAVLGLTGNLEGFVANLKDNILGGLIDFIVGVFTGDWELAWQGIKKIFVGIITSIVMVFESAVNLIIKGLNWLIDKMNALLEESFIAKGLELVGVHFTGIPNIPKVDLVSKIPALAQGAVIPPNREFLAVLGDQKQGTNIETPLSTMVQAFRMALSEGGYNGQNEAVLEIDGEAFGRLVYRMNKAESTRIGVNLAEV